MIVKVCGMRDAENIRAVEQLGVDWIGFIFWPDSPRYVKQINSRAGIIPDYSSLKDSNDDMQSHRKVKRVGVFVDDMPQNIVTRVYNYNLDMVQLNGNESAVMIDNLRRTLDPDIKKGVKIIKTLKINDLDDVKKAKDYVGNVDYFLFDTTTPQEVGYDKQCDWSLLASYDCDVPFLIGGAIGPSDVEQIKAFHHPMFAGIDLNSRFETSPAVKDIEKLKSFLALL